MIESLADVAATLGVPVEDLLANLKHTVKVNGETIDVTLSELQAGYQKDKDYRQKTETLKREREQFEAAAMERAKTLEESHAQAAFVLNALEQQIAQSANAQKLERLRQTNPQEWAARRLELQDRLQALNGLKQQAAQSYAAVQQQMQQERMQSLQKTMEQERQALVTAIPDWSQETNQRLTEFLQSDYGFSPEQVSQVYDHRLVKMAYEAMKWRESQRSSEVTVAKVNKAPKLVKPSTPQSPVSIKAAQRPKAEREAEVYRPCKRCRAEKRPENFSFPRIDMIDGGALRILSRSRTFPTRMPSTVTAAIPRKSAAFTRLIMSRPVRIKPKIASRTVGR